MNNDCLITYTNENTFMDSFSFDDCEKVQAILDIVDASKRSQDGLLVITQELAEEIETVLQSVLSKMLEVAE